MRRGITARAAVLAAAVAAGGAVTAQAGDCRHCTARGVQVCDRHKKGLAAEQAVELCSEAIACKTCKGTLQRDCKSCRNEAAEGELRRREELAAAWLAERRRTVDAVTGRDPLLHCRCAHVDLAFSVGPLTVGETRLDPHALMHVYAERIEALRARFLETFGFTDADFSSRLSVFLFKDVLDHQAIAPRVTGGGSHSMSSKVMGVDCAYSAVHDQRTMPGDEGLWRSVVHNVTHLLLGNAAPAVWIGNRGHGWVDEGVAHWFEDLLTGKCTNYCYEEVGVAPGAGFKNGRWRVPLRKLVEAKKLKAFAALSQLNTDQLDWQDHAQAFACVDYLVRVHGGPAFKKFVVQLKGGKATRDALADAFGLNPLEMDARVEAYIVENYPLEEKER
jgi:hypothetical protein